MLDVSEGAVNETTLGDARPRRGVRNDPARTKHHDALRQTRREGRVAQRDYDSVARFTSLANPRTQTHRLGVAQIDQVDERFVGGTGFVERRAMVVQPRPLERGGSMSIAEPRHDTRVGRQQSGRAEEQRRFSGPAGSHNRYRLARADGELDVDDRLRTREARFATRDVPLGESGDFESRPHADR